MSFTAKDFVFDNIPTELHGLVITSINGAGEFVVSSGGQITPITDKTFRDPVHHLLAIDQPEPLQFELELTSQKARDRFDVIAVANWLTEQNGYRKLQIDQEDLKNAYFNCLFTSMSNVYYHNSAYSFRSTVLCDAPWAWEWERRRDFSFPFGGTNSFKFNNTSSSKNLMMPVIEVKLSNNNNSFKLINKSLNNLTMSFDGLVAGESIYIDCARKIINSFDRPNVYITDKFNKKFFGFARGLNEVDAVGAIDKLTIRFQYALKVGG